MAEKPVLFRYIRPEYFNEKTVDFCNASHGGITFLFEIDQETRLLRCSFAICPHDEPFSFKIGKNICQGRFDKNVDIIDIDYDRSLSLIDNVYQALCTNKAIVHVNQLTTLASDDYSQAVKLKTELNRIISENKKLREKIDGMINNIIRKLNAQK
jgi:hypothetical protein